MTMRIELHPHFASSHGGVAHRAGNQRSGVLFGVTSVLLDMVRLKLPIDIADANDKASA